MSARAMSAQAQSAAGYARLLADFRQFCATHPPRSRLFASGRIGPRPAPQTGTTMRCVAVLDTAAIRITTVQPPRGPRAV